MFSFLVDPFMQMALWTMLLASLTSGTVGSFVVIKRIIFIAGSISHSILAGMGFCLWLQKVQGVAWIAPIDGAFVAGIVSALLIGYIHLHYRQREDAVIASIWSTGMAIGVIFIAITPGNSVEMMDFLFGNILWATKRDLLFLALLNGGVLGLLFLNYRKFMAICFDEEQAYLQGLPVKRLYLLLLSLIAVTVVLLVQIVGAILIISLLTIPATLASLFTKKLSTMMTLATLFSMLLSFLGLAASYNLNWPPGASVALFSAVCYLLALLIKQRKWIRA